MDAAGGPNLNLRAADAIYVALHSLIICEKILQTWVFLYAFGYRNSVFI